MTTGGNSLGPESERGMACLAYVFTWITGLIVLLTAKKEEKFKRWHAIQAIGLGIAAFALAIVFNIVINVMRMSTAGGAFMVTGIMGIFWILVLILIVILAVKAYQGKYVRLPVLAGFADKNA